LCLDIVSFRNNDTEEEEENPFLKTNTVLSKELKTVEKNRPFSTITHDTDQKMFEITLFLLPHQLLFLPITLKPLIQLSDDSGIDEFNFLTSRCKCLFFFFFFFF
jgi:hypothetical protein